MNLRAPLGTLLACCAWLSASAASADAHPPLWRIDGQKNSVYLLASVHVLRATDEALPASVMQVYKKVGTIYMEVDLDDLDPAEAQEFTIERGMLPESQTLQEVLGADRYSRAHQEALKLGIDLDMFTQLEPWVVALTIAQAQFMKLGLDPEAGVEHQLMQRAAQDRKEIRGLETLTDQLGALDSLSMQRQGDFLVMSLDEAADLTTEADQLIGAWSRGDTDALARTLLDEFKDFPELYRSLVVDRNRKWADEIGALLNEQQNYLIVVGALHLVGKDSVIELLRAHGHPSKRE
ncbi:MAG TPA: TraB/GumN family protein [Steroidobacteraceae bacterium]|nr:TraB/GumN family protein [Steroidobacteraceae bacterium]